MVVGLGLVHRSLLVGVSVVDGLSFSVLEQYIPVLLGRLVRLVQGLVRIL